MPDSIAELTHVEHPTHTTPYGHNGGSIRARAMGHFVPPPGPYGILTAPSQRGGRNRHSNQMPPPEVHRYNVQKRQKKIRR